MQIQFLSSAESGATLKQKFEKL